MSFEAFGASLAAQNAFKSREVAVHTTSMVTPTTAQSPNEQEEEEEDEWDWNEENGDGDKHTGTATTTVGSKSRRQVVFVVGEIEVVHLPLHYAPLLSSHSHQEASEPSLFVLSHPVCATAFPLLLTQVLHQSSTPQNVFTTHSTTTATSTVCSMAYAHVKEVVAEHIPSAFRRTLKLVAHVLGEMLVRMRLDAKERIYAMGATSLKIGHTLLRILNELHEDLTTHALQSHQPATIVLVDRTSDLASPCSFGASLLDRVLELLPQTPDVARKTSSLRKGLHVTEIFPIHGCEPTPLSAITTPIQAKDIAAFAPSAFIASGIQWKGGASLCHPRAAHSSAGSSALRALALRPAKLALRDLDKRLQEVEHELVAKRKITRSGSMKKPGEKTVRGRDVVLRRIANILEAGEPSDMEHTALIELGIIVLETLERMEHAQKQWDSCRERVVRHLQLKKQQAGEWIIPELVDTVQRQRMAARSSSSTPTPASLPTLQELLTLLVHAFALSSSSPVEDYTHQMIRTVVSESVLEAAVSQDVGDDTSILRVLLPELMDELGSILERLQQSNDNHTIGTAPTPHAEAEDEEEDWGWDEVSPRAKPAAATTKAVVHHSNEHDRVHALAVIERHLERFLQPLKECVQLYAKQNDHEFTSSATSVREPRSLVAQLCHELVAPITTGAKPLTIPELEHIVDASEQLTRAGIDLLKSGFSRFGFGSGDVGGSGSRHGVMGDSKILIVFVVGGITFEEVQEVHSALSELYSSNEGTQPYQVILGSTTKTNNEIVLEQLFTLPG